MAGPLSVLFLSPFLFSLSLLFSNAMFIVKAILSLCGNGNSCPLRSVVFGRGLVGPDVTVYFRKGETLRSVLDRAADPTIKDSQWFDVYNELLLRPEDKMPEPLLEGITVVSLCHSLYHKQMTIYFRVETGEKFALHDIKSLTEREQLEQRVRGELGLDPRCYIWMFNGKQLNDDFLCLWQYAIGPDSTIDLVMRSH